jgi:hypothetical protein
MLFEQQLELNLSLLHVSEIVKAKTWNDGFMIEGSRKTVEVSPGLPKLVIQISGALRLTTRGSLQLSTWMLKFSS